MLTEAGGYAYSILAQLAGPTPLHNLSDPRTVQVQVLLLKCLHGEVFSRQTLACDQAATMLRLQEGLGLSLFARL